MFEMPEDFIEPIARYRIMYHQELPEEHKAAYRLRGINPDDLWSLEWSFDDKTAAEAQLAECIERAAKWGTKTYKMVDARDTFRQLGAQDCLDNVTHCIGIEQFKRANERAWYSEGYEEELEALGFNTEVD